jgi:DNA-binding response OmpR family regulator
MADPDNHNARASPARTGYYTAMSKKILLVDDERELVETVKPFLEDREYEVSVAYNGKEALEKARACPDLILLDIIMPGIDGFEVLRRLRADPVTCDVPVIMLTAKGETRAIFEARSLKATDYLIKPFSLGELSALIGRYLDEDKRRPLTA